MAEWPKEKRRMDLGFSGLDSEEKPKFVKALIALGLNWGTRPKLVMDYCIRLPQ